MHRMIQDQSKGYKGGFNSGDCVRVQNAHAKGKMWRYLGHIKNQTEGKDSYNVILDSGDQVRRHKRFIRLEPKGEDNDKETKECEENADLNSTPRADMEWPERVKT